MLFVAVNFDCNCSQPGKFVELGESRFSSQKHCIYIVLEITLPQFLGKLLCPAA